MLNGIKNDITNKTFWKATAVRAIKTICQTAIATIGTATLLEEVKWPMVISASLLAGILSVLTCIMRCLQKT